MDYVKKFQEFLANMNETRKIEAKDEGHMTVRDLYDALSSCGGLDLDLYVGNTFMRLYPDSPHSYRGYYEDLSFELASGIVGTGEVGTVDSFMSELSSCVGEVFTGWKGGDFTMGWDTLLWFSTEGDCSGVFPVDVDVREDKVVILTDVKEW